MRRLSANVLCAGVAVFVGAGCLGPWSDGDIVAEQRQVSGFDVVELSTSGDVDIEVTGTDSLTIEATESALERLTSDVVDGRLGLSTRGFGFSTGRISYSITAADLSGIVVSGSGDVDVRAIESSRFEVRIAGSGDVRLEGVTDELTAVVSGSGSVDAADLEATDAAVEVSGSGHVRVDVSDALEVRISGSGSVDYTGDPSIDQRITGSGSLQQR